MENETGGQKTQRDRLPPRASNLENTTGGCTDSEYPRPVAATRSSSRHKTGPHLNCAVLPSAETATSILPLPSPRRRLSNDPESADPNEPSSPSPTMNAVNQTQLLPPCKPSGADCCSRSSWICPKHRSTRSQKDHVTKHPPPCRASRVGQIFSEYLQSQPEVAGRRHKHVSPRSLGPSQSVSK